MARNRKEPKPYTLKQRRGDRPYRYSEQHSAWRASVSGRPSDMREANYQWVRRFSPDPMLRDPQFRTA